MSAEPRRPIPAALAAAAVALAAVLLGGLSVTLGQTVHPILGWALPTAVALVAAWSLAARALDERAIRREAVQREQRAEPLTLPPPLDPSARAR